MYKLSLILIRCKPKSILTLGKGVAWHGNRSCITFGGLWPNLGPEG